MPCSSLNINVLLAASLPDTKWSYLNINDLTRPCLLQGKTLQYFNWVFTVQQTIFGNTNCADTITIKTPFSNPYLTPFFLSRTTKTRLLDKCKMLVSTVKLSSSSPQIPTLLSLAPFQKRTPVLYEGFRPLLIRNGVFMLEHAFPCGMPPSSSQVRMPTLNITLHFKNTGEDTNLSTYFAACFTKNDQV